MVTFAQAQERAEEWINGDVPGYQHREVRVREFELGFVVWAEDRAEGPRSDGGGQRLVIARDSGEATLWPALPVGEVIRRYEEEYGGPAGAPEPAPAPAARVDLNQTSFLLSPPEWLQEAADRMGIPDRRAGSGSSGSDGAGSRPAAAAGGSANGAAAAGISPSGAPGDSGEHEAAAAPGVHAVSPPTTPGVPAPAAASPAPVPGGATPWPDAPTDDEVPDRQDMRPPVPADATPWAGTDTNADPGDDRSVPLPATVFAPPLTDADDAHTPPPVAAHDQTALMSGGSQLPRTTLSPVTGGPNPPVPSGGSSGHGVPDASAYGYPQGPGAGPGTPPPGAPSAVPSRPLPPNAGDIADAATSKAQPPRAARGGSAGTPHPPSAPGVPGARPGGTPPPPPGPGAPAGGYVPTQLVSQLGPDGPEAPPGAPTPSGATPPPGGVHHAATMLAGPAVGGPGAPQPPGAPGAPGAPWQQAAPGVPAPPGATPPPGGAHHAATMLAGPPVGGPGALQPPGAPGAPGGSPSGEVHHAATMFAPPSGGPGAPQPPQGPGMAPGVPQPLPGQPLPGQPMGGQQPAYGYPQTGQPTVGPGYQAVLRYRAQDGSEQQLIRRSAPGMPHPEWQILHELRAMNVPPQQVLELHTELESCELPGAYCARMIRETFPQARITSIAPYGTDHASRQQGMHQLLAHHSELHQVADGPARPAPVRAPIPPVQPVPPVPPEAIGQELAAAFGPGVFRFDHAAVSRQGVPPIVAHTLVVAGLPVDMGPFFWAQAQPGRPVPTLAELAQERGVAASQDAGSYLVMGSDFGKAICVQYGTANIVAVPVEAGPGGAPVPPQFVNTGLPEFARCLALLGRMWRLRFGLNQEQAGRWTVDFQAQLASLDPAALASPESWWSVLLEEMWDGLL
ncbi:SUKH-4 family immunity protein [Streptomyces sp. NPDC056738]|uniref:SUKH-4 family immunity protein n=1 Tax=Streptomyces sp. NPDC056738 TaxID=3345933 RepID=UPI00369E19E3